MNLQTKQQLFDSFLSEWQTPFSKIPSIVKTLLSFPSVAKELEEYLPLITDDLHASQREWVSLVAQFDNPIEANYYKPYWVPICKNSFDLYIDLSSPDLPLFTAHYFFFEPYQWYDQFIMKSTADVMLNVGHSLFDLKKQIKANEEETTKHRNSLFRERERLGLAGLLKREPVEPDDLQVEIEEEILFTEEMLDDPDFESYDEPEITIIQGTCEFVDENTLVLKNVQPYAIGLLNKQLGIRLCEYGNDKADLTKYHVKIKTFKGFLYLLKNKGFADVPCFHITFDNDLLSYAKYKDLTLTIHHTNKEVLLEMKREFEKVTSMLDLYPNDQHVGGSAQNIL